MKGFSPAPRILKCPRLLRPRPLLGVLGLWLGLAALAAPASGQTKQLDLRSFYRTDLRAEALGNAFGPLARGEHALLYNPAGLVQYAFDIKVEASLAVEGEAGPFALDTFNLLSGSPTPQDLQSYLTDYLGKAQNYRAKTFYNGVANLAALKFGAGIGLLEETHFGFLFEDTVANGSADIDPLAPSNPATNDSLRLNEQVLSMRVVSLAFPLLEGQLLLGLTLKNFDFEDKTAAATFGDVVAGGNVQLSTAGPKYTGQSYDLGILWRMEAFSYLHGQWSLVANNWGGISLAKAGETTLNVPASYDIGFAMNPEFRWGPVHLLIAFELEDVTGAVKVSEDQGGGTFVDHQRSTSQRLHMGAELGIWKTATGNHLLSLRGGYNKGLPTYGFELNLFSTTRLVYTHYQDDFGWDGASVNHSFQAVQLTLGFAF